jgi:hypothetical protein
MTLREGVQCFTDSDKPEGVAEALIRVTPTVGRLDFEGAVGDD